MHQAFNLQDRHVACRSVVNLVPAGVEPAIGLDNDGVHALLLATFTYITIAITIWGFVFCL